MKVCSVWGRRIYADVRYFVLALVLVLTGTASAAADDLAIANATVFDATGAEPYPATVIIRDGVIAGVDRSGAVPQGLAVLDAEGYSLLPGFRDLHTHFTPRGEPATTPQIAAAYLASGVTSILDYHQAPEAFAPRRTWLAGIPSPRVGMVARMSTRNGHGADWSDTTTTRWVNTPVAAGHEVDELTAYQPDAIKVFTDGWRYGSGVDNTSMDEPTLTALVETAHQHGLKVLTHTVTVDRAAIAGRSGVDMIVHSILDAALDEEAVDAMRSAGTAYVATLAVYEPEKPGRVLDPEGLERRMDRFRIGLDNLGTLHEAGVLIALGTDAGMPLTPHGVSTSREMELMVSAGLTPTEALMAATINSARALGVQDRTGTIEVGKVADLVLIRGRPWQDIREVRNVAYTLVDGQVLYGKGSPDPVEETHMKSITVESPLIDDFDRDDGRTSRDTLRAGDPDGGRERTWQIFQTLPVAGRGRVLHLSAEMAARPDARAGVILPLNRGGVQPADVSDYAGIQFDARGDAGEYLITLITVEGSWSRPFEAGAAWERVMIPFSELNFSRPGIDWSGEHLIDVRFLARREGGTGTWMELDDVMLYRSDR